MHMEKKEHRAKDQYDGMSRFYEVLYAVACQADHERQFFDTYSSLFSMLPENARILDSSCGNGVKTAALAKAGYRVVGTDISSEMVGMTRAHADREGVAFPTHILSWDELSDQFSEPFNLVLCIGNSIVHSRGAKERTDNLRVLAEVTVLGGLIAVDSRNWEKILRDRPRFETSDLVTYEGKEYLFTYIWHLDEMEAPCHLEILFIEIRDRKHTTWDVHRLDFTPFGHQDLLETGRALGLSVHADDYEKEADRYTVVFRKP